MNKPTLRAISIGLCALLCLGGTGAAVYAFPDGDNAAPAAKTAPEAAAASERSDASKDETVYVLADADGGVKKIIVSDWIKNTVGSANIADRSDLADVQNVKGDETYSMDGENMRVWDAQGNDIYYQGNIEKELPVDLSVSYQLDGKAISAAELAGKSGRVTIRFDYENRQYETVNIDGKNEKMYVPFAMLTGMLLDNDIFRNVEVSGGKLINDGDRTAVIGLAFPGLQDNLALDKELLDIPDHVEITADATNFAFGMTVTIATNEVFNGLDTDKLDSLDGLDSSLGQLTNAMSQLMDGSSALYGGLCTLLDKSGELVRGIDRLADGAQQLKSGTTDLNAGATDLDAGAADLNAGTTDLNAGAANLDAGAAALKAGMAELSAGLSQLTANNEALNSGAKQVFDTLLATANTQIAAAGLTVPPLTVENYADVLNGVISSLDETKIYDMALQTVTQKVEENRPLIVGKVTATVREQVQTQVTAVVRSQVAAQVIPTATGGQMTKETYDAAVAAGAIDEATQQAIEGAIDAQMASEGIQTTIAAQTDAQLNTPELQKTIAENVELQVKKAIADNMASDEVKAQLAAASEGTQALISLKGSLDSYNAFYLGLLAYTDGVSAADRGAVALNAGTSDLKNGTAQLKAGADQLKAGADQLKAGTARLKAGTDQLKAGADQLLDGILQLKNGAPALVDGVTQLKNGSMQLSDGLRKFNEEGVKKLTDALDGDVSGIVTRLKATVDVSKEYRNFSGISDGMDGQVKFIYRTDAVKADGKAK